MSLPRSDIRRVDIGRVAERFRTTEAALLPAIMRSVDNANAAAGSMPSNVSFAQPPSASPDAPLLAHRTTSDLSDGRSSLLSSQVGATSAPIAVSHASGNLGRSPSDVFSQSLQRRTSELFPGAASPFHSVSAERVTEADATRLLHSTDSRTEREPGAHLLLSTSLGGVTTMAVVGGDSHASCPPPQRSPEAGQDSANTTPKRGDRKKKHVHFPSEPISDVQVFEAQDTQQIVMQVKYSRPGWCLTVGVLAALLRGLAWGLVAKTLHDKIDEHGGSERDAIAIATRLGFEMYGGSAVLFAVVLLLVWRPSNRDIRSLKRRRELRRMAVSVATGALCRIGHVLALAFAVSATYVGLYHALPLVWIVIYRSFRRPPVFTDLAAAALLCAGCCVLLVGDSREHIRAESVPRRWAALGLCTAASLVRSAQRNTQKLMKAHFSIRLMLLCTMCADAVVMLIAAIASDLNVVDHILNADDGEGYRALGAIAAMTGAVVADAMVSRYFDLVSGVGLTALTLPAAVFFFRALSLPCAEFTFGITAMIIVCVSAAGAVYSSALHRAVKSVVISEGSGAGDDSEEVSNSSMVAT